MISDGETFCHEEKRDLDHQIEYPERDCVFYRLTNSERGGRYRLIKHILADPHRSVLLVHTRFDVLDESLRGKLRLYALLAPHLARHGAGNFGWCSDIGGNKLLHAERKGTHLVMGCSHGFSRRSVGYVGASDGWQDLMRNFKMTWEFPRAGGDNIALTGEIDLQGGDEFLIAIALGRSCQSTVAKLLQSLAEPFDVHRETYVRQWQRTVVNPKYDFSGFTSDGGHMYRLSRCLLLAHEDKSFQGALVASMSIPWGETKGDDDLGGYHLVWTPDLVQNSHEMWSARHPIRHIPPGKTLRLIVVADATIVWSTNDWVGTNKSDAVHLSVLNPWFVDLATEHCPEGSVIKFTFFLERGPALGGQESYRGGKWTKVRGRCPFAGLRPGVSGVTLPPMKTPRRESNSSICLSIKSRRCRAAVPCWRKSGRARRKHWERESLSRAGHPRFSAVRAFYFKL